MEFGGVYVPCICWHARLILQVVQASVDFCFLIRVSFVTRVLLIPFVKWFYTGALGPISFQFLTQMGFSCTNGNFMLWARSTTQGYTRAEVLVQNNGIYILLWKNVILPEPGVKLVPSLSYVRCFNHLAKEFPFIISLFPFFFLLLSLRHSSTDTFTASYDILVSS